MAKPPPPRPGTSPFVTAEELATQLRVDITTVRRWCQDKQLQAVRIPGGWRIHRQSVVAFLGIDPFADPAVSRG